MSIKTVCKDCEERYPACHDHCEKYKNAKTEYENIKRLVRKERKKEVDFLKYYYELNRKLRGKK